MIALRQILDYQKPTKLEIKKHSFQSLVREVVQEDLQKEFRFQASAMLALQDASEAHPIAVFKEANLCAMHAKRVTVMMKDNS